MISSLLNVSSAGDDLHARWDAFIDSRAEGPVYHLFAWKCLNQEVFHHRSEYLVARRAGAIEGVLPLVFVTSPVFGRILCSV